MTQLVRCEWAGTDPLYVQYHDEEWGVPEHDDHRLFEMLTPEGAQAGLSWLTILRKRAHSRHVFAGFDQGSVAAFDEATIEALLQDPGIVRNRAKVHSTVENARAVLGVQREFGTFDAFIWQFVGGQPVVNRFQTLSDLPAETPESRAMSRELTRRGMRFVGPTICYAFMQATGMVNDHVVGCFRYNEVSATG